MSVVSLNINILSSILTCGCTRHNDVPLDPVQCLGHNLSWSGHFVTEKLGMLIVWDCDSSTLKLFLYI